MQRIALGILLLLLSASTQVVYARHDGEPRQQAKPAATAKDDERLLALGKKLFVERCAKCHDVRGDKPLPTGLPLNQRKLTDDEIARMSSGRLKTASAEEKRAVAFYISSLMKKN
jgi:mono/diheme cytochrome c family protein